MLENPISDLFESLDFLILFPENELIEGLSSFIFSPPILFRHERGSQNAHLSCMWHFHLFCVLLGRCHSVILCIMTSL